MLADGKNIQTCLFCMLDVSESHKKVLLPLSFLQGQFGMSMYRALGAWRGSQETCPEVTAHSKQTVWGGKGRRTCRP